MKLWGWPVWVWIAGAAALAYFLGALIGVPGLRTVDYYYNNYPAAQRIYGDCQVKYAKGGIETDSDCMNAVAALRRRTEGR